jgi:uncharacterized membrane protein
MNPAKIGRILVIIAIGGLFMAYALFIPTAFSHETIADYIKNHFVREIVFGSALAIMTIFLALKPTTKSSLKSIAVLGSVIVLPFWFGSLFGWSTGDMSAVWGQEMVPKDAYMYHGSQTLLFYLGVALMGLKR